MSKPTALDIAILVLSVLLVTAKVIKSDEKNLTYGDGEPTI